MFSLDENGNSLHRRNFGKPNLISQIQTEIAKVLGMERGIDKRITKRTHITPRQYRQAMSLQEPLQVKLGEVKKDLAEAKKQIKELERQLKEANKQARADLQEQGASRPSYALLEAENRKLKNELDELKKAPDLADLEDFSKLFKEKIKKLKAHPKLDEVVEKTIQNEIKTTTFGNFDKASVLAYVSNSVVVKQAATDVLKEAQTALTELATKKEISVKAQLAAIRKNKTLSGFLGAVSKTDVDVAVLKRENAELTDTVDSLQRQLRTLQKTLKATSEIVAQKDAQIAELTKANQEGFGATNDRFFMGQASMLAELVGSGKLCVEPKGRHLVDSLGDYLKGGYSTDYFEGIKSGLLSYCPASSSPKNDLEI